ncbi:autotransporter outer membrane beta-barrel domain-containing protein [Halomonas sp. SH5A2]|uniref:autotransporter domain-containing protein n=1 Tax=Halomonas sp. SH5A2 TaxID=2749040 RepID=UPI00163F9AD3|nr:autotransporter outer membrane beta-barrel domain-containing protein [Halomonas sp. SH5A2]QNI02391.1 autotransporter outer membrane beta-barrel domain-containing protein [Halomonas sp. SH5A2]
MAYCLNISRRSDTISSSPISNVDSHSLIAPQQVDVESSYQLIGYGRYDIIPALDVSFQADQGINASQGERFVTCINRTAEFDYDSYTGHVGLWLNKHFRLMPNDNLLASLVPDYTWFKDDAYQEEGAGILNLSVNISLGAGTTCWMKKPRLLRCWENH